MAAATYPAEPDATKALDYQGVIALAQPDRVDGDPVAHAVENTTASRFLFIGCELLGQHVWTWPHGTAPPKPCTRCLCGKKEFGVRPAPPAVTHTGPQSS